MKKGTKRQLFMATHCYTMELESTWDKGDEKQHST